MACDTPSKVACLEVMIADDHPIVRHGLSQLIDAQPDMHVRAEAGSVAEALEQVEAAPPDVAIIDISFGDENGMDLVKRIKSRHPEVKMLVCSVHDENGFAARALRAGAMGYVEKRESVTKIVDAIRQILRGDIYVSSKIADSLLRCAATGKPINGDPVAMLTDREMEVFELIGRGITVRQVARRLAISPKTVESHRKKIKDKLHVKNSAQLNRCAFDWAREQS